MWIMTVRMPSMAPLTHIATGRSGTCHFGVKLHLLGSAEKRPLCLLLAHRDVLQCHAMSLAIGGIADIGRQPGLDRLVANE